MSYEPHTWQTGETITAAGLNKIEQGIANAGSGGTATIKISATGFGSTSHLFGWIVFAYKDANDAWIVANDVMDDLPNINLYGFTEPEIRLAVVPLSSDDNVGLFLIDAVNDSRTITGDISTTPTTIAYSYGSIIEGGNNAYRITGNGSYTFVAT